MRLLASGPGELMVDKNDQDAQIGKLNEGLRIKLSGMYQVTERVDAGNV
jgi:hypothetical protein